MQSNDERPCGLSSTMPTNNEDHINYQLHIMVEEKLN